MHTQPFMVISCTQRVGWMETRLDHVDADVFAFRNSLPSPPQLLQFSCYCSWGSVFLLMRTSILTRRTLLSHLETWGIELERCQIFGALMGLVGSTDLSFEFGRA
ncbi:hypothetical protein GALMADRAFT_454227 [Galerina marginata CBS 339.88]|uniref:Uncharacterized protein n=1 Tax=Galerina marginata (strain CBS 339.88) TaxID=685588 RepID=A0A067T0R1_GALM3|nr:hypothetical protein GALMADRAFT_454227 [Galerina marginata CBS 339.88]